MTAEGVGAQWPHRAHDATPQEQPEEDVLARTVGDANTVRAVFDELPTIATGLSVPEYRFEAVNEAYREFVGRQNLIGSTIREVFPELMTQQLFELADRVRTSGQPESAREWRFQMDLGATGALTEFFLDMVWAPRHAADGSVAGLTAYGTDVTERVRERQALQAREADAERRYENARDVALAFQEALLPSSVPILPNAWVAARYLVAGHDQAAGGDWFDALPLADGKLALVVGDVVGHGVAASAAMGQLRAVVTELLTTGSDLQEVLARIDAYAARNAQTRATTLVLLVLDPRDGTAQYCTCGHPEPLVVGADGSTRYLPTTGAGPLGTGSSPTPATDTLGPGELVLLYSDGLIERPNRSLDEGRSELARVAADAATGRAYPAGAAPTPCERVCQLSVELLTRTGYADDVTALAALRLPSAVPVLEHELSSDPAELPGTRGVFEAWLDGLYAGREDRDALELAVWEAVSNAVEHAYPDDARGPISLRAALCDDGYVECTVSDHGSWREPDPSAVQRGRGLLLAGQLMNELQVRHPPPDAPSRDGERGTTVKLRHRLGRPAIIASEASAAPAAHPARVPYGAATDTAGDVPRVTVRGPIDIVSADDLGRELLAACRGGVLPLTIGLAEVSHLASAGVRVLHEVQDRLAAHGQQLTLLAPPGSPAAAILDLVHLPRAGSAEQPGASAGVHQPAAADRPGATPPGEWVADRRNTASRRR